MWMSPVVRRFKNVVSNIRNNYVVSTLTYMLSKHNQSLLWSVKYICYITFSFSQVTFIFFEVLNSPSNRLIFYTPQVCLFVCLVILQITHILGNLPALRVGIVNLSNLLKNFTNIFKTLNNTLINFQSLKYSSTCRRLNVHHFSLLLLCYSKKKI